MFRSSRNKKGVALILVIVIMLFAGIFIFSITMFVRGSLDLALVKENRIKAINAAQCGIYKAIEDFKRLGSYSPETNISIWLNEYYTTAGGAANFMQVDASALKIEAGGKALRDVNLKNISGATSSTIVSVNVSWTPNTASENLVKVSIGGADWVGSTTSGSTTPITQTLLAGSSTTLRLQFDVDVIAGLKTIQCTINFSDGTSMDAFILINGKTAANGFNIKCTGSVVSNITWKRTLIATYDVGTGKVTSWNETNSHI